jgi:hypothetical protein
MEINVTSEDLLKEYDSRIEFISKEIEKEADKEVKLQLIKDKSFLLDSKSTFMEVYESVMVEKSKTLNSNTQ